MQRRSTEEWIAITVAVVLGLGLFVMGFFFFGSSQSTPTSDIVAEDELSINESDEEMPAEEAVLEGGEPDPSEVEVIELN